MLARTEAERPFECAQGPNERDTVHTLHVRGMRRTRLAALFGGARARAATLSWHLQSTLGIRPGHPTGSLSHTPL
jgi:hypothetical protein